MSDEIKFLEKYADTLGLRDKPRKVFLERFNQSYFSKENTSLAKDIFSEVEVSNPAQTFQDHLKTVLIALSQAGSTHKEPSRGRAPKGQESWKQAYQWLWDKPYSEYLEKYGTKPPIELDELCKEASRRSYRHLTISKNPLMAEIGLTADQSNVVSLEIVERKQISKKREDIQSSEQGSSFYQPTENEQGEKFSTTDRFLDEVIRDRKTKKSQGKRIAITGEAGAGKTTLLQSIGIYLEELNKDLVPIWISLKQVTKSIEAYLVDEYLRDITGTLPNLPIPSEYSESLNNLLKSGQVVLLLDGADESTERNILGNLGERLNKPIFDNVQVILTCRINTWDTQWQSSFDVYRIIPFTYPVQVESFIDRFSWGDGENLAGDLKKVLKDEGKSRLVDMVTNPLRLALLCYLWKNGQQSLPHTRAELYRLMLEAFYRQKELEFGSPSKDLENALGQLALSAFNKEEYRYLLSESDVSKLLGSLNDKGSLFWQATKKFGLLNQVGKSSINPNENTYAFYHASFQEYFAALAINDWNEFLPSDHVDKPVKDKCYRIFSASWKEVILFWVGDNKEQDKEKFITALLEFQSGCADIDNDLYEDFYNHKAFFLAASVVIEYNTSIQLDRIRNQLITLALEINYDTGNRCWIQDCIREEAWKTLREWNIENVIIFLNKLLTMPIDIDKQIIICEYIGELETEASQKYLAIQSMKNLLEDPEFGDTALQVLLRLNPEDGKPQGIYDKNNNNKETDSLLSVLNEISFSREEEKRNTLEYEEPQTIIDLIWSGKRDTYLISRQEIAAIERLEKICTGDREVIVNLIDFISNSNKKTLGHRVTRCLKKILTSDLYSLIIRILKKRTKFLLNRAIRSTKNIKDNRFVDNFNNCYEVLWHCAQNMSYPDFYKAWHSPNISIHPEIVDITPSNNTHSIQTLENQFIDCAVIQKELERTTEHPQIRCFVVDVRHLEQESDPNVIAEEIAIKIFDSLGREIPEINRVSNLKRELINLKRVLGVEKLAIALYGKSANKAINQLCQNLAPIHIRLFTGGQTIQELITQINAWLSEM